MNRQTIAPIGQAKHTFSRMVASYTLDAQYDYKMLTLEVTLQGLHTVRVALIVSGRKAGKPFQHVYTTHDPAVDKYNSIQYDEGG